MYFKRNSLEPYDFYRALGHFYDCTKDFLADIIFDFHV